MVVIKAWTPVSNRRSQSSSLWDNVRTGFLSNPNRVRFIYQCCILKAMVGWERRIWKVLTENEVLSAFEHLRI